MLALYGIEGDWERWVRDDDYWAAWAERVAPYIHPEFGGNLGKGLDGQGKTFSGLDGLRAAILDLTAPLTSYRGEIEETIDLGERVVVLLRDYARLHGSAAEIKTSPAHLMTFRDHKIIHWESFPHHAEALKAVGMEN